METYSKLTTSVTPNAMYCEPRQGRIEYIILHHNATTNKNVAMSTWYTTSGNWTSAHYEITDNEIIGCVGENYTAYHAGGTGGSDVPTIPNVNHRSIGLEHVNSSGAPYWSVSDATLRNSAKLIVDICNRYGLPINRNIIKGHNEVTATACPGGINVNKVVKMAQELANGKQPEPPKPPLPTPKKEDDKMFIYMKKQKNGNTEQWFVCGDKRMYLPNMTYVKEANDLIARYGGSKNQTVYNHDNFGLKMIEKAYTEVKV
ncbi:N-acetylmuramoyl-L-alanine amidase [Enterococcus phage MDA1]|uniref:N-acetylmuramoyl-L-alanine amidase n=1 Tax=Enterococcus phage MDA1 TaxID=2816460 RepID=A0AAE7UV84_9CAUD|nr:endolysin [Enterococcus phage MDA1]QTZ83055.1 N-acetylmuramoyl-L-alanine amidase [Enterococcus phage MDA1]